MQQLKDSLIPHENNDYLPYVLRRFALLGMLGMVLLSFLGANLHALLWQQSQWLVGAILPAVVVELTNEERSEEALPPLRRNAVLDAAAKLKAEDMAKNSYFAHYSPTGVSPWHWFAVADYSFVHAGENLAVHFSDSGEVVEAWMDSPSHRANIVNGNYQEIGVGTAKGKYEGYDTVFVVQLFGTQAATPSSEEVATTLEPIVVRPEVVPPAPILAVEVDETSNEQVAGADSDAAVGGVEETNVTNEEVPVLVDTVATTPPRVATPLPEAEEPAFVETVVNDDQISLYSSHIATSTNLKPLKLAVEQTVVATSGSTPFVARLATAPSEALQLVYLILGVLVALALFLAVLIEWRRQHVRQVIYGTLLLVAMSGLFYVHMVVTAGAVII